MTSSYTSNKPTVSSIIPITEDYYKRLTHTLRLGYSKTTRVPKMLNQPKISYVNLDEYLSMPTVKYVDIYKASS